MRIGRLLCIVLTYVSYPILSYPISYSIYIL